MIGNFEELLALAADKAGKRIVVVFPANPETFAAVEMARRQLGARFLLAGDRAAIEAGLASAGAEAGGVEILDRLESGESLRASIAAAREGKADIVMKGSLDTATLLKAVLESDGGLRTGRLLSDVFVFEYPAPAGNRLVMITDGGVTLAPDLKAKAELIRNAVEVAHALGNPNPKVAVLSASEFVQPALASTLDAAALAKMNERGQISGCVVDGPLALDNAVSPRAAEEKRIRSAVAGAADILLCPNIECANALAKAATYFGNLRLAHVIAGARVPVLIPSRADSSDARLLSIALGMILSG